MRLRRIVFWTGSGLLALVALAVSWLLLADLGQFKPQIERWASGKIGRQISIAGALNIDLAQRSIVIAEDIHVANADWADEKEMLSVGRVEVHVDLRSILGGPIVVELLDIDDVNLLLDEPESGKPNWELLPQSASPEEDAEAGGRGLLLQKINLDQIAVSLDTPRRAEPLQIMVTHFEQQLRDDDFLDLSLSGTVNKQQAHVDGRIGTWEALLAGRNVRFDIDAQLDTVQVRADGLIDELLGPRRPTVNFKAYAPDINDLLTALGIAAEGEGKIDLSGSLAPATQGPLTLELEGQVGRLDIEASGAFSDLQNLDTVDIDLHASAEDIRPILAGLGIQQDVAAPFEVRIDAQRKGKLVIFEQADIVYGETRASLAADVPHFPTLDDATVRLEISGRHIDRFGDAFGFRNLGSGPFSLDFSVDVATSGTELVRLNLHSELGEIQASGSIVGVAPDFFGSTLSFRILTESLQEVAAAYGVDELPDVAVTAAGGIVYQKEGIRTTKPLQLSVDDLQVQVDGLIKPVQGLLGSAVNFELSGPDLAATIARFAAVEAVPDWPYDLAGELLIRAEGYRFLSTTGNVGSSAIKFDGLLVPGEGIAGSRFDIAASGPAFEEFLPEADRSQIEPGSYDLVGRVDFGTDSIAFKELQLQRAEGKLTLNLELGMPTSGKWAKFDLLASGGDVRSFVRRIRLFEPSEAPFLVDLRGERQDTDWNISHLNATVGAAQLTASGDLDMGEGASSSQFKVQVNVPNTAMLGTYGGVHMGEQAFALNADIVGSNGFLEARNLTATLGESIIKGDVRYRAGDVPDVAIQIVSDSIVFAPLLEEAQDDQPEAETSTFEDGRLIPDAAIPFEAMRAVNAAVKIDVARLQKGSSILRDVVVSAELKNGVLDVSEARLQSHSGAMAARVNLDPAAGNGKATLELLARQFAFEVPGINEDHAIKGNIDLSLSSTGNDLRTVLGNANGVLLVETYGGRVASSGILKAIYGGLIDEVVGAINPFRKSDPYTTFSCIIIPLQITDGVVQSAPSLLITTDKIRMASEVNIDLKSESLEMNIRSTPKKGISFSAGEIFNPYIKVVGTLAAPTLSMDEKGVLISGGAAVATGGLSILAKAAWDRMSRAQDPCQTITDEGKKVLGNKFPQLPLPALPDESAAVNQTRQ